MALFDFADLQPAPASPTLRGALQVDDGESLLARRLRGYGKWDAGRRVVEIIVPSRLPDELDYRAKGLLDDVLDDQAPDFTYGEHYRTDLLRRYRAGEFIVLHQRVEAADPPGSAERQPDPDDPPWMAEIDWDEFVDRPLALQVFFESPRLRDVRYAPRRLRYRLRARRSTLPVTVRVARLPLGSS